MGSIYLRQAYFLLLTIFLPTVFALLLCPGRAQAHVLPQERKIIAQISADRVEILVEFLEPPNERAKLLVQRFDLDGDGELRGPEATLAGGVWIKYILSGLQLEVLGEAPAAHAPEIKFHREKKGALTALLYLRWDLPKLEPAAMRTLRIKLQQDEKTVPTALSFSEGEHTEIREIAVPLRFKGNIDAAVLSPGDHAHLRVQGQQLDAPAILTEN